MKVIVRWELGELYGTGVLLFAAEGWGRSA